MAAFKALIACSMLLRNGLYSGFLSSELAHRTCTLFASVLYMYNVLHFISASAKDCVKKVHNI